MYLRNLHIQNLKLLRDLELDFTGKDGEPRPFTVLVGENGLCKTSVLQAIALAASGVERSNQLANAGAYPDLRQPEAQVSVRADFSFSQERHSARRYPLHPHGSGLRLALAPTLWSLLTVDPGFDVFRGDSGYFERHRGNEEGRAVRTSRTRFDPLGDARGQNLPDWFIAGYGVVRTLPAPMSVTAEEIASPSRDRLLSLFKVGQRIIGTGFADLLPQAIAEDFNEHLRQAFVDHGILLNATGLSLRTRGNVRNPADLPRAHHLSLHLGTSDLDVPTTWLSQGYQATMAWVADLIGQVWWEARKQTVPLSELEGICLIDEIDLHLHPRWQATLVTALKAAFPRIQFIATTHSPMVLPGLKQDEVILLRQDDEGNVVKVLPSEGPALKTGSELYQKFFGIDQLQPQPLNDALIRYGTLGGYAGRSAKEDKEAKALLAYLRANDVDPGWEPVPRTTAKTIRKRTSDAALRAPRRK